MTMEPRKSPSDDRTYRQFVLENKLQVLVISDPSSDLASASMDVRCGSLWNPTELGGLAHFLEHMLFLGTEKYPQEGSYQEFCLQHGGSSNAYTSQEDTNYYFEVAAEHLENGLDSESATQREMNAVNSEYENNKTDDGWRLFGFDQFISNPNHRFHNFSIGNLKSLKDIPKEKNIDVRQQLLKFYDAYYSSNIMKLVILGRESLDELEAMAKKHFAAIKNKNLDDKCPGVGQHPAFDPKHLPAWYHIIPTNDLHNLKLYWPFENLHKYWEKKPDRYLAHLVGHEGDGSILAHLKTLGWALGLSAGSSYSIADFEIFSCTIALTEEGLEHVQEIISIVYQYIEMLKKDGVQKWIWEEIRNINDMEFRFLEKSSPSSYTRSLSSMMQLYPPQSIISGSYELKEYDPNLIKHVLDKMTPENMIVQVVSHKFDGTTNKVEEWFGVEYSEVPIDGTFLKSLHGQKIDSALHLPERNMYIPVDFSLKTQDRNMKYPEIIYTSPISCVWHKLDTTFLKPKSHVVMILLTPEIYNSPGNVALAQIFVRLCSDELNRLTYYADIAGLSFTLSYQYSGVTLEVAGYNDKLALLTTQIVTMLATIKPSEERFKMWKEQQLRDYDNQKLEQAYQTAQSLYCETLYDKFWSHEAKKDAMKDLNFKDLLDFIPRLLNRVRLCMLCQGNISQDESRNLITSIENILKSDRVIPQMLPTRRLVKLKKGVQYHHRSKVFNPNDSNSCLWMQYQIGSNNTKDDVLLELLSQVIETPFYEQARTKEQLGYAVWSPHQYVAGVGIFAFVIQSPQKDPLYLEERVDAFLDTFKGTLSGMTAPEFEKHVNSLMTAKTKKYQYLSEEVKHYWQEITDNTFRFDKKERFVEALKTITKQDLVDFFETKLHNKATRRRISFQLFAAQTNMPEAVSTPSLVIIQRGQEAQFRHTLPLYPVNSVPNLLLSQ